MQRLWKTLHSALGETSGGETGDHTADEFATFFTDKVALVRASTATTPLYDAPLQATPQLTEWTVVTVEEVEKLIGSAPIKTCQLDPVPTWLVKDMRSLLLPSSLCCSTHHWFQVAFLHNLNRPLFARCC